MGRNYLSINSKTGSRLEAFTLVELLVVISVIALLMGILTPVLHKVRMAAWRTVCASNLRNLAMAFRMYLDESGDIMPPAAQLPSLEDPTDPDSKPPITQFLLPHVSNQAKIFKCPGDNVYFSTEGTSYEYNSRLGGRPVSQTFLAETYGESNVHVMYDYECFHGKPGKPGAKNYLYADGHVGDLTRQ